MAWFRLYDTLLDDPKIQMLSDKAFRMLINLWCVAKRGNGKITGDIPLLAFTLHVPVHRVRDQIQVLLSAGLIEHVGDDFTPHKWGAFQYESDNSTTRTQRYRNANKNRAEASQERHMKRHSDADCDDAVTLPEDRRQKTEGKKKEPPRAEVALPDWLPIETWTSFLETRKKPTRRASELLILALTKLRDAGDDPQKVLEQSIMNGWKGLFPLKKENSYGRKTTGHDAFIRGCALAAGYEVGDADRDQGGDGGNIIEIKPSLSPEPFDLRGKIRSRGLL